MNHTFGRRVVTTAVTLAATAGTLLAVGTAASAAPNLAADHAAVSHVANATPYGDHDGERNNRGDGSNERDGHDRRHHWDEYRGHHHGEWRFDGHRRWERGVRYWYSPDQGRHYRFDGHRFYQWERGMWIVVISDEPGFDGSVSR
ncbi:hypothetical protein [Streptomyces sp. NPDC048191]|uniref:hypothetical protein n=1 Tax=Streptomyces sp. NPDC048191 TaxID=3155484 RepID=UPI003409F188